MITHRMFLPFLTAALLAGCATLPVADEQSANAPPTNAMPAAYLALGTEPFWNLEITPERLNFNRLGEPAIVVANPGERQEGGDQVYVTGALSVRIVPGPCSDGMSDRRFADSVSVRIGNGPVHLNGCGGGEIAAPQASLERSGWRITAVNGHSSVVGVNADLNFAEGRVTGTAGCNRLMGTFTQARERLTFGAIAGTRMACAGPRGEQESRVLAILSQPLTVRFGERMTMTWTAPDGSSIALRRLDWD